MYLSLSRLLSSPTFSQGLINQSQIWAFDVFGVHSSLYRTISQAQLPYPAPSLTQNNAVRLFMRPKAPLVGIDSLIWDLRRIDVQKNDDEWRALIKREAQGMAESLDERSGDILQNRLLSENPKTFREIGEAWGVSPERVRQISLRIRERLIHRMEPPISPTIATGLANVLDRSVESLELKVRAANCLRNLEIQYIGELIQKTESDLLRNHNFGSKSLMEIKTKLAELGLCLNMYYIDDWQPPHKRPSADSRFKARIGNEA